MSASTIVLPPPTCTARRKAGQRRLRLLFCCEAGQLLAVVSSRPVPAGSSAAVLQGLCRSDCPPAVFACSGLVLQAMCACSPFAMPCPLPLFTSPRSFCFARTCSFQCAPGSSQATVCKLQELSRWQLQRGSAVAARPPCCIHPPSTVPFAPARRQHLSSQCAVVRCAHLKGGGLGLHVSSQPSSPHLHFASQRLHVSSLAPC